jgi:hypothetical protein
MSQAPTSNTPLSQEASREEKAAILKVEADRAINTLRAMSSVLDPPAGGRFAKPSPPVDPAKLYAPLPASSPWHSDPVPNEEPLGFSVEDMPVMGEPFEVERAAAILEHSAATVSPPQGQSDEAGSSLPPPAMADLASPLLGSAPGPSPAPLSSDERATDPPLGSSDPSFFGDQQLAAPLVDAAPRADRRDGAALSSRGSITRRFG